MGAVNETVVRRGFFSGPSDALFVGGLAALMTAAGGIWVVGQLAGLLFRRTWPTVPIGQSLRIGGRLPQHLADPRQAWPPGARDALPGPVGIYTSVVLVLAVLAVSGVWVVRRRSHGVSVRGMASPAELDRTLAVKAVLAQGTTVRPSLKGIDFGVEEVGLRLGRTRAGQDLAISTESSVLVLAAPRQGKSSQIVIPWLHRWPGPALAVSLRKDVLEATAMLRAEGGRPVWVMAPTGMVSWPHQVRWSPTSGCEDFDRARRRADLMVTVGKGDGGQDAGNAAFFGMSATNLLAGWLHAAALRNPADRQPGRGPMDDVLAWALDERDDTAVKLLRDLPGAAPGTAGMLDNLYRSPEGTRSNLWTTVQTAVAPLLSPMVRKTFVPPEDSFDFDDLIARRGTVYLLVAEQDARQLAPLMTAFDHAFQEAFMRHAATFPGGRADPPVLKIIDEMANTLPNPNTPDLMSSQAARACAWWRCSRTGPRPKPGSDGKALRCCGRPPPSRSPCPVSREMS